MKMNTKTINATKKALRGYYWRSYHVEYGQRALPGGAGRYTGNALLWDEEADLWDTTHLGDYREISGAEDFGGMVLLDLYLYQRLGGELGFSTNCYILYDALGAILFVGESYAQAMKSVQENRDLQRQLQNRRKLWTETAEKWRIVAKMPKGRGRKAIPLGIVADWVQDQDGSEAQEAAAVLREAIAAGWDA